MWGDNKGTLPCRYHCHCRNCCRLRDVNAKRRPATGRRFFHKDRPLANFARELHETGWGLLASKGTKVFLDTEGIPSVDIGDIVGEPILGHRVVTLSRELHAGLLADLNKPADVAELERLSIRPIHLVYAGFYPLEQALCDLQAGKITPAQAREMVDIGGPTIIRAANKGGRITLANPLMFNEVLAHLNEHPDDFLDHPRVVNHLAYVSEHLVHSYTELSTLFYYGESLRPQ